MKKNKSIITLKRFVTIDGYSQDGTLILYSIFNDKISSNSVPVEYLIVFNCGFLSTTLRRFNSAVTAMRSYRRFITMSEEIKRGIV